MTDDRLIQAEDALIRALGRQSAFWGLGRTAGEMYAVLYLSPAPVPLEEVARRLGVTKGNVSIAIRQLEQLGLARRSWEKGDRRVFFVAETDFWKIAHSVLSLRHKPEFKQSFALVAEGSQLADGATASSDRDFVRQRFAALQEFYRLVDSLVEIALAMEPEQLKALAETLLAFKPATDRSLSGKEPSE